jgi:hypothetical protein
VRRLLASTTVLLAAACTSPGAPAARTQTPPPSAATVTVASVAQRPLRLPRLAAGAACPVTRSTHRPDPSMGAVVGDGPAGPVGAVDGVLSYGETPMSRDVTDLSWGIAKVLWAVDPAEAGDVVVRGRQLDGPNTVAFSDPPLPELRLPRDGASQSGDAPAVGAWRGYPGYTRIRAPGCYGFQVDAPSGTSVIVLRADGPAIPLGCAGVVDEMAALVEQSRGWPPLPGAAVMTAQRAEQRMRDEHDRLTPAQQKLVARLLPLVNALLLGDARIDAGDKLRSGLGELRASCRSPG